MFQLPVLPLLQAAIEATPPSAYPHVIRTREDDFLEELVATMGRVLKAAALLYSQLASSFVIPDPAALVHDPRPANPIVEYGTEQIIVDFGQTSHPLTYNSIIYWGTIEVCDQLGRAGMGLSC